MLQDLRLFVQEFFTHFASTGAIAPSSPALGRAILKPLRSRPPRPIRVLEVGPGTGAFTFQILKHLRAGDTLHIYELNPKFHAYLERRLSRRPEASRGASVKLCNEDIRRLRSGETYDYIVSGLPFANFEPSALVAIMDIYLRHLSPHGVLSWFEYLIPHRLRLGFMRAPDRRRMLRFLGRMRRYAKKHEVKSDRVWLNLPPARARHLKKRIPTTPGAG